MMEKSSMEERVMRVKAEQDSPSWWIANVAIDPRSQMNFGY